MWVENSETLTQGIVKGTSLVFEKLPEVAKASVIAHIVEQKNTHVLVLSGNLEEEQDLYHNLPFFTQAERLEIPSWETIPSDDITPSPDVVGERLNALRTIQTSQKPLIILASLQAVLQKVFPQQALEHYFLELRVGQEVGLKSFVQQLETLAYVHTPITSDKGSFSVRGGIVDLFPVNSPHPYRIEFFDDEISSIRIFDPIGQRSIEKVDHFTLTIGQEDLENAQDLSTLLEFLGKETVVVLDDLLSIEEKWVQIKPQKTSRSFLSIETFLEELASHQTVLFSEQLLTDLFSEMDTDAHGLMRGNYLGKDWHLEHICLAYLSLEQALDPEDSLLDALACSHYRDHEIFLTYDTAHEKQFLSQQLATHTSIQARLIQGYLSAGLVTPDRVWIPYSAFSHRKKMRRQKQRNTFHSTPFEYHDLSVGELVVHQHHGIGQYLGIETQNVGDRGPEEFFAIAYANQGRLLVPISHSYLITKYIGSEQQVPKLHTLGSKIWKNTKERTEQAIVLYAKDLLEMYAQREISGGFAFPKDSDEMQTFEQDFPYEETQDQLQAIEAIKGDMSDRKPMDRLVCGDVGYGKTEVAMRAAFKATMEGGKQVAVLVPTTILAIQHYENFCSRMGDYGVRIGCVSRFYSAKQNRQTLDALCKGELDVIVGTHKLVQEDVVFKDLGLVIVDEEQRFGVKAKEFLRKAKAGVDCLTLSATPIPRTLYMSIIGVRDVSVISTPPSDRIPIKSVITSPSNALIQQAITRELQRDGQVYAIHNRVETIYGYAENIRKLVPHAKIVVAHGQLSSKEIDDVFHAFKAGKANVLVATTIVESGIDIPNANTILIDQADRFGIADLYQLRGRVGRWNRRAFCYFLVKNPQRMAEISRKRLEALATSSGYGGGMKVAMRDLELRGAGDILGYEQSGHVSQIGFHHYCKLLTRTIKSLKGEQVVTLTDCRVEIPQSARLPQEYVSQVSLRMEWYTRLGEAQSCEEVESLVEELVDRFGPLPPPAVWLMCLTRIKIRAALKHYQLVKVEKNTLILERSKNGNLEKNKKLFIAPDNPELFEEKLSNLL